MTTGNVSVTSTTFLLIYIYVLRVHSALNVFVSLAMSACQKNLTCFLEFTPQVTYLALHSHFTNAYLFTSILLILSHGHRLMHIYTHRPSFLAMSDKENQIHADWQCSRMYMTSHQFKKCTCKKYVTAYSLSQALYYSEWKSNARADENWGWTALLHVPISDPNQNAMPIFYKTSSRRYFFLHSSLNLTHLKLQPDKYQIRLENRHAWGKDTAQ